MTLEQIILRIRDRTGACLFEIGTPANDSNKFEVAGWSDGRWVVEGETLLEAFQELEKVLPSQRKP